MPASTILATRAIATVFARQLIQPIIIIGYSAVFIIFLVLYWLANQLSPWWWIFAVPLFLVVTIFTVILIISTTIIRKVSPQMTKYQRNLAKQFVDEVGGYSELIGASRLFIAYKIINDVVRKKPKTYVSEMTQKPGKLKQLFSRLQDSFNK
jgi:ABC-type transport system involved in cytochrome bd biosynthesis fused ATPase/permease subunit